MEYTWTLTMDEQYPIRLDQIGLRSIFQGKPNAIASLATDPDSRKNTSKPKACQSRDLCQEPSSRGEYLATLQLRFSIITSRLSKVSIISLSEFVIAFAELNCMDYSCEASDLFSTAAALTDRSTDSWIEGNNWPLDIQPDKGTVQTGKSVEFTVKFSPLDVFEYKAYLKCK